MKIVAAALALLALAFGAGAQYPNKPIRLVAPFAPGGTSEIVARSIAQELTTQLGQTVYVENKGGGAGAIAMTDVAKSPADGYHLIIGHIGTLAVNPFAMANQPYDVNKDFVPVALLARVPNLFVVNAEKVPAKDLKEFIALAKAKPGELSFSSAGTGGAPHLAGEMFKTQTGTELLHVPYRGSGPAVIDLIAGRITMMFDATPSLLPHITAGKLRPMAAASPQRHRLLPDVPSFAELGLPGMDIALWYGVVAPGGTPAPIVQRLNTELAKIVEMPDVRKNLTEQGADMQGGTPEDFGAFMRNESARWSVVVKQAGIKQE